MKPYISVSRYEGFYTRDYLEQRSRYMAGVYERSHGLIRAKDYQQAQKRLRELNELDPKYKDVKSLLRFSEVEPVYTAALEEFEMGKYKEAYYRLQPMYKKYPDQNELKLLMDEALDRGMYRIASCTDWATRFWSSLTVQILTSSKRNKKPLCRERLLMGL